MTVAEPNVTRLPDRKDTIGLDLACLEHKASEILAEILVVKEARDHGHAVSLEDVRGIEGRAKFLASLSGILRMKLQTFPREPRA